MQERATGQLQLSAGYSSLERFLVNAAITQRNFMGRGQEVRAEVNWSSFSKEAARRTGLSTRSIDRTRELAAGLAPEAVALIRSTKIADNQAQLQALAALDPADQVKVAREIAEGRAPNFAKAKVAAGMVPEGGTVREADRPLARIEPMLARMSLADLQALASMVAARIAALTPAKPARAKKGGAE